jgi:hypothetical protein
MSRRAEDGVSVMMTRGTLRVMLEQAFRSGWEERHSSLPDDHMTDRREAKAVDYADRVVREEPANFDAALLARVEAIRALRDAFDPQGINQHLRAYLLELLLDPDDGIERDGE